MPDITHVPVLLDQVLELLAPGPGMIAVDCTAGCGGHSLPLSRALGTRGQVLGCDLDAGNLDRAAAILDRGGGAPFTSIHGNFIRIPSQLRDRGLRADMLLADLGLCSTQLEDPGRGFSFDRDGPLDMRFVASGYGETPRPASRAAAGDPPTAADLLRTLDEDELADLLHRFGEEPLGRKIARKLVQTRALQPIETTGDLAQLVVNAYGSRAATARLHPATRTFMALRIAVNGELGALEGLLDAIMQGAREVEEHDGWLNPGARVAIISFHSLEDRMVKRSFIDMETGGLGKRLTPRPVVASRDAKQENPRARSARLRVFQVGT